MPTKFVRERESKDRGSQAILPPNNTHCKASVLSFGDTARSRISPPAQTIYLSAAFTSPSKKLKVFLIVERTIVNKYLLVCHVGSGPFPQKQSFPYACINAMCCHGNASSKASDGLSFSPVGSFSTSLAWLCEYNGDWDAFFSFSGTLKSFGSKRAE